MPASSLQILSTVTLHEASCHVTAAGAVPGCPTASTSAARAQLCRYRAGEAFCSQVLPDDLLTATGTCMNQCPASLLPAQLCALHTQ